MFKYARLQKASESRLIPSDTDNGSVFSVLPADEAFEYGVGRADVSMAAGRKRELYTNCVGKSPALLAHPLSFLHVVSAPSVLC
jgi:hypothetical protein